MTLLQIVLTAAFVLSGAAGLIYESIWSRYLGLFVGHSAYAQTIVLVIFLGGMSAGSAWVARHSASLRSPLMWYARAEAACGVIGLAFHGVFGVVTAFCYDTLFPALPGGGVLIVIKWLIAAVLILPQSVLLGTTFPLMSAGYLRATSDDGRTGSGKVLANLYFANSLGAAIGVLIAGFVLISAFGLPGTLQTAAILNVMVAALVVSAVQFARETVGEHVDAAPARELAAAAFNDRVLWRTLMIVAAGTAVSSFIYEIAWVRMLSLVLGSATHSFELMLSAFILGLSLGALWVRKRADRFRDPMRALAITQWVMGGLAMATMTVYIASFDWMATLLQTLAKTDQGYAAFSVARYAICLAVMMPATFCAGITLPLITRMLIGAGAGERAIGAVYSINTLGSIVGAALAALVLMPLVGLKVLLVSGAVIDMGLGVWLLWIVGEARGTRKPALALMAVTVLAVLGASANAPFTREVLTSGVYRYGRVEKGVNNVVFYKDGRTATVSVRKTDGKQDYALATNGKPDASLSEIWFDTTAKGDKPITGDESTQLLLPMVVLAHVPRAAEGAVIGQGSGMSSHFLLGSPYLKRLTTIDIEPEMVRGSHTFYPVNRRVFDDPRSHFVYDDARSVFASARRQYDFILSEPSNPWVSGVSGLFTDEFYHRAKQYLAPHGVFGQWLHLYEIDDGLVLSVVRAVHRNFASYRIYLTNDVDILIVASNDSMLPSPDWSVLAYEKIAADLKRFRPITSESLEGALLGTRQSLLPAVMSGGPVNSDFHPVLDLGAERTRYRKSAATGFMETTGDRFDVLAALDERRIGPGTETREALILPRTRMRAKAARLRANELSPPTDTAESDRDYRQALARHVLMRDALAAPHPPADWFTFFRIALETERDWHAGMSGVVDSVFYRDVEQYMTKWKAPETAHSAWRLLEAAGTYNWPGVVAEVTPQLKSRVAGHTWLPVDLLCSAAVVAMVRTGDKPTARKVFEALEGYSALDTNDLRLQVLRGLVARRVASVPNSKDN